MKYSKIEIKHLFISWLAISLAFAIARGDFGNFDKFVVAIIFSAITVGLGFIAHELSHKYLAQKYGAFAEFRANFPMLGFAVLLSITGIVFAAPGAVIILGRISKDNYGKVSAAGPISNFILAILFGILALTTAGTLKEISSYGFLINSWLGAFNLLPFGMFDGQKILNWNKTIYGILVAVGFILIGISGYV